MKSLTLLFLTAIALGLASCANSTAENATRIANDQSEASGSPFRWKTQNVGGGGTAMFVVMIDLPSRPSTADAVLKRDTLALIAKAEASKGRTNPELEDVKILKDGREVWILKSGPNDGLAYIVHFKPAPQGGIDIGLNGPHGYQKGK